MDDRTRLAGVLRELRALGVDELFLDALTAEEATSLVERAGAGQTPAADPHPGSGGSAAGASTARGDWRAALADPAAPEPGSGLAAPVSAVATGDGPRSLAVLGQEAAGCTRCRLSEGRRNVVFGRGSAAADLVVVGEAPGSEEDRTGLPFVGPAGKLLDLLLLSIGFDRESVYICNVLKCRPPNNRNPLPDEVEQCSSYLHGQLEAIAPRALLAVGKFAGQTLTASESSISALRGRVHTYRGIPLVATYHPAYLLRTPSATRKTWQDFQLIRQVLDESA